jgi:chromosome segregation protein
MRKEGEKIFLVLILLFFLVGSEMALSQSADELRQNIDSHNEKIKQLDEEIEAYTKQIEAVGSEAKNLQSAVKVLDINQSKIKTEIKKTETNISKTNLTLKELVDEIGDIEIKIGSNVGAIAKTLSSMRMKDDESLIESLLVNKSIAEVLDEYETIREFQEKVRGKTFELDIYKNELLGKKSAVESEKKKLVSLNDNLKDQNQILTNNKQ